MTTRITLLTKADCDLCEHAKAVLARVAADTPGVETEAVELTSETGRRLAERAGMAFPPAVLVDGEPFSFGRLSERKLRRALARAASAARAPT